MPAALRLYCTYLYAFASLSSSARIVQNFFLLETLVTLHRLVRSMDDTWPYPCL